MVSCVADWGMILQYLKAFISWPPVTLALVGYFVISQRGPIGRLIDRVKGFKLPWLDADASGAEEPQKKAEAPAPDELVKQAPASAVNLPKSIQDAPPESLRLAFESLSQLFVFERTLNQIFGTQLRFLRDLSSGTGRMRFEDVAMNYLANHQRITPIQIVPPTLANWSQFLRQGNYIQNEQDGYSLTDLGRQLVKYTNKTYGTGPWRNG